MASSTTAVRLVPLKLCTHTVLGPNYLKLMYNVFLKWGLLRALDIDVALFDSNWYKCAATITLLELRPRFSG